jgi:hypothetical protein
MDAEAVEAKAPGELRDVALPEVVHVEEEREERGVAALHVRGEVKEDEPGEAEGTFVARGEARRAVAPSRGADS